MAITLIESPLRGLAKGLLAGAKFAQLASQIKAQDVRNTHDAQRLLFEEANSKSLTDMREAQGDEAKSRQALIDAQVQAGIPQHQADLAKAKTEKERDELKTSFITSMLDPTREISFIDEVEAADALMTRMEIEPTAANFEIVQARVRGIHAQLKAASDLGIQKAENILAASTARTHGNVPFVIQQWFVTQQTGFKAAGVARAKAREMASHTLKSNNRYDQVQQALKDAEADYDRFEKNMSDYVRTYGAGLTPPSLGGPTTPPASAPASPASPAPASTTAAPSSATSSIPAGTIGHRYTDPATGFEYELMRLPDTNQANWDRVN